MRWAARRARLAFWIILFLFISILWLRSHSRRDEITFRQNGRTYAFASSGGRLLVDNRPEIERFGIAQRKDLEKLIGEPIPEGGFFIPLQLQPQWTAISNRPAPRYVWRTLLPYWIPWVLCMLPIALSMRRFLGREWRLYRGRCPHCGYDTAANTSGVCPECGASLDAAAAQNRRIRSAPRNV